MIGTQNINIKIKGLFLKNNIYGRCKQIHPGSKAKIFFVKMQIRKFQINSLTQPSAIATIDEL